MYWLNASKLDFKMYPNVRFKLNEVGAPVDESSAIISDLNGQFRH